MASAGDSLARGAAERHTAADTAGGDAPALTRPRRGGSRARLLGGRPRARRLAIVLLSLAALWPPAAWAAARALVVREPLERADVLLILSGAAEYEERARFAARLFREGRAPKVWLTDDRLRGGWSEAEQRNPYFYERARAELIRGGVPAESIEVILEPVESTSDEAALAREYADARGLGSLVVVTSAYHSRRALWTFRKTFGGSGTTVGLDAPEASLSPATWWLSREGWRAVGAEFGKLAYYRLRRGD
jgi:uncharacterized SAM-binding protein YcdF (DUF218 family)